MTPLIISLALVVGAAKATPVHIVGNEALPDEVYLTMIDMAGLQPKGAPSPKKAGRLAKAVERFLKRSGYEIAHVEGLAADDALVLNIDEGRVGRIVFSGLGEVATIQLRVKVTLSMPHNIFNRPALTRQIEALREEFGLTTIEVDLVETPAVDHLGPQLDAYPQVAGVTIVPLPAKYDLHVRFGKPTWQSGFGFILDLKPPDGVKAGLAYTGRHLVFDNDRWWARAAAAMSGFGSLLPDDLNEWVSLTRVAVDGFWASPRLFDTGLRLSLSGYYDLKGRQRQDIALQKYYWMRHGALGHISYDLDGWLLVSLGAGVEGRWLFEVEQRSEIRTADMPVVRPFGDTAGIISLRGDINFEPDILRLDCRHTLWVESRALFNPDEEPRWSVRAEYQKVFGFGWHDLFFKVSGIGQWGSIRFVDEESLGDFLRSVFGTRHWVRRALGVTTELRFSITRDVFKVGVFYEQALFEDPARGAGAHRIMYANSMGPSLYFLLFDTMQASFYYSFGIDTDGFFEHGFSAGLVKAF